MFQRFVKQPGANEVALEAAGLILGAEHLKSARDGRLLSFSAAQQAKRIERALDIAGGTMAEPVRDFLTKAQDAFKEVGELPSADMYFWVDAHGLAGTAVHSPDPEWRAKFDDLKATLADDARAVTDLIAEAPLANEPNLDGPVDDSLLGKLSRAIDTKPTADAVTLETAQLLTGDKELKRFINGEGADEHATRQADRIGEVLRANGDAMDPDMRGFLLKAHQAFTHLGEVQSSLPTREIIGSPEAMVQVHESNPAWDRELKKAQQALGDQAASVVKKLGGEPKPEADAKAPPTVGSVARGFGKWLRGPTPESVTLEIIGLVKGTEQLNRGYGNQIAAESVGKVVKRAENVLRDGGKVLHPDVQRLFKDTIEAFKPLSEEPSSEGTGEWHYTTQMAVEEQRPRPEWNRGFETARAKLDVLSTRVFATHFAPALRDEIKDMDKTQLAEKRRDEPQAMALMNGHLKRVRAP